MTDNHTAQGISAAANNIPHPAPPPAVQALATLDDRIDAVAQEIDKLINAVSPILAPDREDVPDSAPPQEHPRFGGSEVVERVTTAVAELEVLERRLNRARGRVEV